MMNAMLMALIALLENAVKYSIAAVLLTLLLVAVVVMCRWALGNFHSGTSFSRSRA